MVQRYLHRFDEILNQMAHKMLSEKYDNNITTYFIKCMIPHHEGHITMCENLLQYQIDPRLVKVAETIIQEQSEGIRELKQVRKDLC